MSVDPLVATTTKGYKIQAAIRPAHVQLDYVMPFVRLRPTEIAMLCANIR